MIWFQLFLAVALAGGSAWLGNELGSGPGRRWLGAYLPAVLIVILIAVARRFPIIELSPVLRPFMWGRTELIVQAAAIPLIFCALIPKLSQRRVRLFIWGFLGVVLVHFCLAPIIAPLLVRGSVSRLPGFVDADGLCRQSTNFTCGPAAAVTVLRALKQQADEANLAIRFYANPVTGTEPDRMVQVLRRYYAVAGHSWEYAAVDALEDKHLPCVAIVKLTRFVDHYVAVLARRPGEVYVGDPLEGGSWWSEQAFDARWRGALVYLTAGDATQPPP